MQILNNLLTYCDSNLELFLNFEFSKKKSCIDSGFYFFNEIPAEPGQYNEVRMINVENVVSLFHLEARDAGQLKLN